MMKTLLDILREKAIERERRKKEDFERYIRKILPRGDC